MKKVAAVVAMSLLVATLAMPLQAYAYPSRFHVLHAPLRACMTQVFSACEQYCPRAQAGECPATQDYAASDTAPVYGECPIHENCPNPDQCPGIEDCPRYNDNDDNSYGYGNGYGNGYGYGHGHNAHGGCANNGQHHGCGRW